MAIEKFSILMFGKLLQYPKVCLIYYRIKTVYVIILDGVSNANENVLHSFENLALEKFRKSSGNILTRV